MALGSTGSEAAGRANAAAAAPTQTSSLGLYRLRGGRPVTL